MENDMENNMQNDMEKNMENNMENSVWERIRDLTTKQALLLLVTYFISFTVVSCCFLFAEYIMARGIIKLSGKQTLYFLIGCIVLIFVMLGFFLLKLFAARSTIKITRKTLIFLLIEGFISILFSAGSNTTTQTAENRLFFYEIQLVIGLIVGLSISLLPKYPPDRNIIEITRKQILLVIVGGLTLIFMLNFCLALFSEHGPDTVSNDISNEAIQDGKLR